jgi:hypothetical protein
MDGSDIEEDKRLGEEVAKGCADFSALSLILKLTATKM